MDSDSALALIEKLAALSVCLTSLELLFNPVLLHDAELTSWPVARSRHPWLEGRRVESVLAVLEYPTVLGVIGVRLGAAAALLLWPDPSGVAGAVLVGGVFATSALFALRMPYGQDGADQVALITFGVLLLGRLGDAALVANACLWFLTLQLCLCYGTAGVTKAVSATWRSGGALTGILSTHTYGHRAAVLYLKEHAAVAKLLGWATIGFECSFPLVLLAPEPVVAAYLLGGMLFHAGCALLMGLNAFFWAFVALYPAVWYCVNL